MVSSEKLLRLRKVITENLRVQRDGESIEYISVGTALQDAGSKQNHAIFARRGCGKTLLLHHSANTLQPSIRSVYLNCEDFKKHSFPNVLIEILTAIFREFDRNLSGWFGRKKQSKEIIKGIMARLQKMQAAADTIDESVTKKTSASSSAGLKGTGGANVDHLSLKFGVKNESKEKEEIEKSFQVNREKLKDLDQWLPTLKDNIRTLFSLASDTSALIVQSDDLYHLKRTDQAFVVDYIHRLCKDVPLYFKIATLRHASTLYADRDGQPIGAQERHDYQPINIDYTFADFKKTSDQNRQILEEFGKKAGIPKREFDTLFKGEGFARLVMAGGGVPRDVLSLFLEALADAAQGDGRIRKDEVRILSRSNFERKIEELKQDSKGEEQDDLLKGIYILREFCLEKQTNVFVVRERMLQQNDMWKGNCSRGWLTGVAMESGI